MFSTRNLKQIAGALAAAAALVACSEPLSPAGEQVGDAYLWTATYATAEKFGGASGTWSTRSDVRITADRRVFSGTTEIINPLVGESSVSWLIADGNKTNASFQLLIESTNSYFWGNVGVAGKLFQGWIQYPGQGKLDYRGLAR
jgi:hypothetical protein